MINQDNNGESAINRLKYKFSKPKINIFENKQYEIYISFDLKFHKYSLFKEEYDVLFPMYII